MKTSKIGIRVVYIDPHTKEQFDVFDSKKESRFVPGTEKHHALAIAPSHYDRDAINYDITQKILDDNPSLKPYLAVGDIVDKRALDEFLSKKPAKVVKEKTDAATKKPVVKKTAKK